MDEIASTFPLGITFNASSHFTAWLVGAICGAFTAFFLRARGKSAPVPTAAPLVAPVSPVVVAPAVAAGNDAKSATEAFATVAHEIKSPVNGIVGIVSTINTDDFDPESRHKMALLATCATHLADLVESLPTGITDETAARPVVNRPFEVLALLESVRVIATVSTSGKSSIETVVSAHVPAILVGDVLKIRQVLLNYTLNALKHGKSSAVLLGVRKESAREDSPTVFCVSNHGPGIKAEERELVFEKFQRGAAAKEAGLPGVGLGLGLCRDLAQQLGGSVWARSEKAGETCFYLRVPLATATKLEVRKITATVPSGQRALVVDDEEHNRLALAGLLEQLGFSVDCAASEPEAMKLAATQDFDLACIDCILGPTEGTALARAIRQLPGSRGQVPILAVSGLSADGNRDECIDAGMSGFLAKPLSSDRLRFALQMMLPQGRLVAARRSTPKGDRFKSLRLIAEQKSKSFAEVLRVYLDDLETGLRSLADAVGKQDLTRTKYCTHGLYGRCTFIEEYSLEKTFRQIEIAAVMGQWPNAQKIARAILLRAEEIKARITFESQTARSE